VVGEFDVATSRVWPPDTGPLLLRDGKVAGRLGEGRAAPFGGGASWVAAAVR
jgi:hypothetical protein